jgi:hypothetical protein
LFRHCWTVGAGLFLFWAGGEGYRPHRALSIAALSPFLTPFPVAGRSKPARVACNALTNFLDRQLKNAELRAFREK